MGLEVNKLILKADPRKKVRDKMAKLHGQLGCDSCNYWYQKVKSKGGANQEV